MISSHLTKPLFIGLFSSQNEEMRKKWK